MTKSPSFHVRMFLSTTVAPPPPADKESTAKCVNIKEKERQEGRKEERRNFPDTFYSTVLVTIRKYHLT